MRILQKIVDKINAWILIYRCNQAKRMADQNHQIDGKRYIVVKMGSQYLVMNNKDRKAINRKNRKIDRITFCQLAENAVYMTK